MPPAAAGRLPRGHDQRTQCHQFQWIEQLPGQYRRDYAGQMVFAVSARNTSDANTLPGVISAQPPVPTDRRIRRTASALAPRTPPTATRSATVTRMEMPPPCGSTAFPLAASTFNSGGAGGVAAWTGGGGGDPARAGRTAVLRQYQRGGKPGHRRRYVQHRRPLFPGPHRRGPDLPSHDDHGTAAVGGELPGRQVVRHRLKYWQPVAGGYARANHRGGHVGPRRRYMCRPWPRFPIITAERQRCQQQCGAGGDPDFVTRRAARPRSAA